MLEGELDAAGAALLTAAIRGGSSEMVGILLLTAKAGAEHAVVGLGAGADDYLAKPFDAAELLARVGALLAQMRRLQARFARLGTAAATPPVPPAPDRDDLRWRERLEQEAASLVKPDEEEIALKEAEHESLHENVAAAQEREHAEAPREARRTARGQHVVGAGAVVAERDRRVAADEDGAGAGDAAGDGGGVPGLDLQVLGGVAVDQPQSGLDVVDDERRHRAALRGQRVRAGAERQTEVDASKREWEAIARRSLAQSQAGLKSGPQRNDTLRTALAAYAGVLAVRHEHSLSWIDLYRALGGGWSLEQAGDS